MKKTKLARYILAAILIIGVIAIIGSTILRYAISPSNVYGINSVNSVEDGSFENFNEEVWDCCPDENNNISNLFAEKSSDSLEGIYSLNLTSSNHCSCINKPILEFNYIGKYLLSFYYKGDNPRFCNWVDGDKNCLPQVKFSQTNDWTPYKSILIFTPNSLKSIPHFYADSDGTKTVTNLYDDLQVHKLIPIENSSEFEYNSEEEYIFKTKADNNVHDAEIISEIDAKTGEAYFLTKGKPNVTIKFPWSEVAIVIIMMLIVVRLLFKKQVLQTEEEIKKEIKEILK